MADFADLEINLNKKDSDHYSAEVRFTQPKSETDNRVEEPIDISLDLLTLQDSIYDPAEYGKTLSAAIFADEDMREAWVKAQTSAQTASVPLRVRIHVGASASELNSVCWETLRDPKDNSPLFTSEQILFSRYLSSNDWRPVRLRAKGHLRALVVISNPTDLESFKLAKVDVEGELERAKEGLGEISLQTLPNETAGRATLNNIITRLREGCDILYLAAHGTLAEGDPKIWLEDENGKSAQISGSEFATRLKELENQPRLVVLASCQSAGKGNGQALQALGPRLAQAGIPAVIAMQGNISMDSVKKFMPIFFAELIKDGQIDRALAVARGMIRETHDFWMPVLFMRLKSGSIWYVPGFGEESAEFQKWNSIIGSIMRGQCTPILGFGLVEPIIGAWRDIASHWAEEYRYPLSPHQRETLPAIAQYLAVSQDINTLYNELDNTLRAALKQRFASLPDSTLQPGIPLVNAISEAGKISRAQNVDDQHKILAKLPLPIYITTLYDNLMADALKDAGKDPQVVICPWSDRFYAPSIYDTNPNFHPTPQQPLVYHLFGHLDQPDSMVLTEDDYFEFIIGFTTKKKVTPPVIPPAVLAALSNSALMFLGFQLEEWSFRVFFHLVMGQQGGGLRARYSHIGVQVTPDEDHNIEPRRARKYLEDYFFKGASINIYWGYSEDFLRQMNQQLPQTPTG